VQRQIAILPTINALFDEPERRLLLHVCIHSTIFEKHAQITNRLARSDRVER
jgi:hypothetical protein